MQPATVRSTTDSRCSAYIYPALQTFRLTFLRIAIYVKSSMCSEKTKHFRHKYYGLFVRMYITSQQSNLCQINTRQISVEA